MDAGALDRRITIERTTPVDDGYQTRAGAWVPLTTVWAQYRPGRGSERFAAAMQSASQPAAFWIRWSSKVADVGPQDRVRFEGRLYQITARSEIGRREGIELMCIASDDGSGGNG
ncbi:phage head closure protein [Sphingomonas sp. Marseille-Q8236]